MSEKEFKYLFGPVPSRRLGRSLGVDLVPFKTCTYDCIYCQLGHTTDRTVVRKAYVPEEAVLDELKERLASGIEPDYITLSGSGEPTLHSGIGGIITSIKRMSGIPVAVLTNGSLLWKPEVRAALKEADLVIPSMDATSAETFEVINRPRPEIDFSRMVDGLVVFGEEYDGEVWLEIFLAKGINDGDDEIQKFVELVERIAPDRVDLNTAVRPPADSSVKALKRERLEHIASLFKRPARVIAEVDLLTTGDQRGCMDDIVSMLMRRPCTAQDIARAFDMHINEVIKYLELLKERGEIATEEVEGELYYRSAPDRVR